MREIIFRAQEVGTKEWVEGLLYFSHGEGVWKMTLSNGWIPTYSNPDEGESTVFVDIIYETISQFTGLFDRSGRRVFDGDKCEGHSDGIGTIKWTDYDGGYEYVFDDGNSVGIWEVKDDLLVLGSIHDKSPATL